MISVQELKQEVLRRLSETEDDEDTPGLDASSKDILRQLSAT